MILFESEIVRNITTSTTNISPVIEDQYNPRLVKELLQDLSLTLNGLAIHAGRCILVGNINVWLSRINDILKWQQQLNNLQIPKVCGQSLDFSVVQPHSSSRKLDELWSRFKFCKLSWPLTHRLVVVSPGPQQLLLIQRLAAPRSERHHLQAVWRLRHHKPGAGHAHYAGPQREQDAVEETLLLSLLRQSGEEKMSSLSCSSVKLYINHQRAGLKLACWQHWDMVTAHSEVTFTLLWLWQITALRLILKIITIIIIMRIIQFVMSPLMILKFALQKHLQCKRVETKCTKAHDRHTAIRQ